LALDTLCECPTGYFHYYFAARLLPQSEPEKTQPNLDLLGSALVTGGLITLVYALAISPEYGWASWLTWRLIILACILLSLFVVVEWKTREPLMPLRIFSYRVSQSQM